MSVFVHIPGGWQAFGPVPASTINYEELTQDLIYFISPDGHHIVDIGWYPDCDPNGHFIGYVIRDNDWGKPVQKFTTQNRDEIITWVNTTLLAVQSGELT